MVAVRAPDPESAIEDEAVGVVLRRQGGRLRHKGRDGQNERGGASHARNLAPAPRCKCILRAAPPGRIIAAMAEARSPLVNDFWGGLSAMLVALPASLAFGVAIVAPLGPEYAGAGALSGLLGAFSMGTIAAWLGGTPRLVSAPCAPAAAVMGALVVVLTQDQAREPASVLVLLSLAAVIAGALQILYGVMGGGTLIKFIPYPVVTGYLSGVAIVIFLKQLPSFLGLPQGMPVSAGLREPSVWNPVSLIVGAATIVGAALAPRLTKALPPPIIGLGAGVAAYFGLAARDRGLLSLDGNPLLIGPLASAGSLWSGVGARAAALPQMGLADVALILGPALTLSVLLSIDTLKTCVLVDALTRGRHQSNREIRAQGIANIASAAIGGIPGAGTSGATLMNLASGASTWRSGLIAGVLAMVAYLLLGPVIAWAPIPALSALLLVVAFRMFDWKSLALAQKRATVFDFAVIALVILVAVFVDLIAASAAGVFLSILLFIRDQVRSRVIHRKVYGDQVSSRRKRLPGQVEILKRRGREIVVAELQGDLFFGTTDQLLTELEPDLPTCRYLILDLRRIESIDFTGVHLLQQIESRIQERSGRLLYSNLPSTLPSGIAGREYFANVGLVSSTRSKRLFPQLTDALEWAEDAILESEGQNQEEEESLLNLGDIEFLKGRKAETMHELEGMAEPRHYEAGGTIFHQGDQGDELFLLRRGRIRISFFAGEGEEPFHVATFGRGDFFGDMAFLDSGIRSASAVAETPSDVFVITRSRFDVLADKHPRLGQQFLGGLARALALRLRQADGEIRALENA
jgi:SulP family sulfate permease